jgi:hypothetical protein
MALLEPIFNKSSKINDVHLFKGRPELRLYDQYKRFRIRIKEVELHLLDKLTDLENSRSALCSQLFLNPDYKRCFFEGSTLNFNKILSFTDIKIHKDFELIECKICAEEHASLFECSFCKYLICRTCRPQLPSIYIH